MASIDPELKTLTPRQRTFIELIAYKGLSREEAYCQAYSKDSSAANPETTRVSAAKIFYTPHVNSYYHALMEEIRDVEVKKGVWTKEVATEKLMRLIDRAEQDIYGDENVGIQPGKITMSRLQAIMLPVKELNQMNGFNQTNLNIEGKLVQICGEDDISE